MIKLHSRHSLVAAADGTVRSLDVEALRRDLRRSFHDCGIHEDWTADHIALVLEEHAAGTGTDRPPLAERDLHAMVSALLSASGYEDVGREYRKLVPAAVRPDDPDPFRAWDHTRVEAELASVLPLTAPERAALVARTAAALAGLGLGVARTELIRELGRHFLQQTLDRPSPLSADSPWLLWPSHWPVTAVPGAERLASTGVIRPHPVSRFLPRVRLELDLQRLATVTGAPPLPEMLFLPALADALDCSAGLLAQTRREIETRRPHATGAAAHLVVCGLNETIATALLPQSPRAAQALRNEVRAIVQAKLAAAPEGAVLVTFR